MLCNICGDPLGKGDNKFLSVHYPCDNANFPIDSVTQWELLNPVETPQPDLGKFCLALAMLPLVVLFTGIGFLLW